MFNLLIDIPGGMNYFMHYSMQKKDGTLLISSGDVELNSAIGEMKDDKKKTKNFKFDSTSNSIYKNKFMEVFE